MDAVIDVADAGAGQIAAGVSIHASATVAPGAQLGVGVKIGPFCTIGPDAVIGDGANLVSHVVVDGHTSIGAGVVLYPFCTVGLPPQDLKYKGEPTRCVIGPRTQIREHCTIHRGTASGKGITMVGADCMLMAVAHVAHDCTLGDHVIGNPTESPHRVLGSRVLRLILLFLG